MDTIIKADVFFFITAIAVIVSSIVLTVAFIYVIQILRDVRYITKRVRIEADELLDDVHSARSFLKKEAEQVANIKDVVGGLIKAVLPASRKRSPRKKS